jgi:WXG100 family type VII secretion target
MGGYAVEPADLQRVEAFAGSAAAQARAVVERIRAEGNRLFGAGWHGPAASAFRLGWEQWVEGATVMLGALDELAALLGSSAVGYASTEEAVRVSLVGDQP